eukprot:g19574.t1
MLTTHVDDLAISATPEFMNDIYNKFVTKFKKVTRQQLPFDHCGCEYSRTGDGYFIGQKEFAKRMKPAAVPDRADDSPLNPPEDLTEKLQRSKEQNKTSADDWYRRYQDAKDDLDAAKTERDDAREDRDKHRSMLYEEYNKQVDLRNKIETLENQLQTEKDRLDGMKKAYDLAEKRNKDLEKRLVEAEREAKMTRSLAPIPSPSTPQSAVIQVEKEKFPERVYITGNGTKYHSEGCHHLSSLAKAYTKCMHCTR